MAVLAITEYSNSPTSPEQWDRYYNTDDDKVYIQILQVPNENAGSIAIPGGQAVRSSKIVTIDFSAAHYFSVGDIITVQNVDDSSFDGEFEILEVPTSQQIVYAQDAVDATSGGGTAEPTYPKWVEITTGRELRENERIDDPIVKAKYPGRDYQTFLDEALSWIKERYGDKFNTFLSADPAIMLAEYVSAAQDELSWYQDMEATEFFWRFMLIKRRANEKARRIGYTPRAAVACSDNLNLTLDEGPYSFDINLQKTVHRFLGPNDLVFELQQDVLTFYAGETSKTGIGISQVETRDTSFVSDGGANQEFDITDLDDDEFIANGSVRVWVGGVEWDVKENFDFERSNQVEVWYGAKKIVFGNGVIGNIPDVDSEILIRYGATKGVKGKLAVAGSITSLSNEVVVNFTQIPITITNTNGATGGDDDESLEEIKVNAPKYFDTANRGTTTEDLTTLINIFSNASAGSVAKGKASIVRGIDEDVSLLLKIQDIEDSVESIETGLSNIDGYQGEIKSKLNDETVYNVNSIDSDVSSIDDYISNIESYLSKVSGYIDNAESALDELMYNEILLQGDGSTTSWTGASAIQLQRYPVAKNSVFIWVDDLSVDISGNDGDCDASSGVLSSASATFTGKAGRAIKIGNQTRYIVRVISATKVEYSGNVISGTNLEWIVYENGVYARDDGNGNLIGNGIVNGDINYTTGNVEITFTLAPGGNGTYGVNVFIQYGYEESIVDGYLVNAETEISNVESEISNISSKTSDITSETGEINTDITYVSGKCDDIGNSVDGMESIPANIDSKIDVLKNYLDEHLSDECRANIVLAQALVVDTDGFYAAPSNALLEALEEELQSKAVAPTTVAAVSGYYYLIQVNMEIEIKVSEQYKYSTVLPNVQEAIDNLFKGRDYGENLYRAQYYNAVVPDQNTGNGGVEGVEYANIGITGTSFPDPANTGTSPSVDSDGNLIIENKYILTKGTITYSEILE